MTKKTFIKAAVRVTPKPVREFIRARLLPKAVLSRVRRLLAEAKTEGPGRRARELETKLWGGFSAQALLDLTALKLALESSAEEISEAARVLACFYAGRGNFEVAYDEAVAMRVARSNVMHKNAQVLIESDCLMAMGRRDEARQAVSRVLERRPKDVDLQLAMANTYADMAGPSSETEDESRLAWINRGYDAHGLARLERIDPSLPLSLDNLRTVPVDCLVPVDAQPKVTVLIPAYNAESTLHIALDSLLAQTWQNLEVIIVDDRSTDSTFEIASRYAERDRRVIALQAPENKGAYACRNFGLSKASGQFVTVHDADDWSHPQKIEIQVRDFIENPKRVGNLTQWVRCYRHLYFRGRTRPANRWVIINTSSLMFRRDLLLEIGGWDEVRVAADTELRKRLMHHYGKDSIQQLVRSIPLSFALESAESLTRNPATHVNTIYYGVRKCYHEAAQYWHENSTEPRLPGLGRARSFPAPRLLLPRKQREEDARFDILFIMDFGMRGGAFGSTLNYVEAALKLGLRVGVFHWARYDLDVMRPIRGAIRRLVHEGRVSLVSPAEKISADTVVVGYPVILRYPIDLPPEIDCRRFVIVTNQMSARLYSGGDVQYDPQQVSQNVQSLFGKKPLWVPISELVRGLMAQDGRYEPIHSQTWTPLIDSTEWCKREVSWRGARKKLPVLGRHSRDHYTKWPTTAKAIRSAYCVNRRCEVAFLGGADVPIELLGKMPKNWRVHPFDSIDAQAFLADLDFYLHFPHEDYIEEFGRAVLEAMAIGVPVILPPVFRPTFGDAALYAEPDGVWPLVEQIWEDEQAWLDRVEAGRRFVREKSDWSEFELRLKSFHSIEGGNDELANR